VALIVQKFGGTSVADVERIRSVARRALATQRAGNDVIVVVSAMAGETNRLLQLAGQVAERPDERELDVVASTGEQVSIGLTALAIQAQGGKARSFTGPQVGDPDRQRVLEGAHPVDRTRTARRLAAPRRDRRRGRVPS
jgi:aspartate kinase